MTIVKNIAQTSKVVITLEGGLPPMDGLSGNMQRPNSLAPRTVTLSWYYRYSEPLPYLLVRVEGDYVTKAGKVSTNRNYMDYHLNLADLDGISAVLETMPGWLTHIILELTPPTPLLDSHNQQRGSDTK
ncbi:hypothetical protein [Changpingibacter yushuensis]|uniref:hypothetical protein n=1 Tax=Changpingibacter yushuensis TaxID=2758440 RepID=UPI00165E6D3B|nr:hypothetical protein [Changpingibacter yushuensis]